MGMSPTPSRPTLPWASARLTMARTPSAASRCWVMPMDHTSMAPPARTSSSTKASSSSAVDPGQAEQVVERLAVEPAAQLVEALGVLASTKAWSTAPRSMSDLSMALASATSPPGRTGTCRSQILVPNRADSTFDGTQ